MLPIIPFESAYEDRGMRTEYIGGEPVKSTARTLLNHLLDRTRRVDLHREEVVEPVHLRRLF